MVFRALDPRRDPARATSRFQLSSQTMHTRIQPVIKHRIWTICRTTAWPQCDRSIATVAPSNPAIWTVVWTRIRVVIWESYPFAARKLALLSSVIPLICLCASVKTRPWSCPNVSSIESHVEYMTPSVLFNCTSKTVWTREHSVLIRASSLNAVLRCLKTRSSQESVFATVSRTQQSRTSRLTRTWERRLSSMGRRMMGSSRSSCLRLASSSSAVMAAVGARANQR